MLINDRHLHVEVHGDPQAPALILLHHGLGSTTAWQMQIPALLGAGWRVVVYDRWGYGRSQPRPFLSVPDFEPDLADLESLMHLIDLKYVSLLGHSDGGTIALHFAANNPEQVCGLISVAAHVYLEPKMEPGIHGIRRTFEQDARFRAAFTRVHGDWAEKVFWNWYTAWTQMPDLSWDMRPKLGVISCPTLVVQGGQDEHATPQHAIDIAEAIPHAQLWLAKGCKHMLPQENSPLFNRKIVEFLAPVLSSMKAKRMDD